MRNAIGGMAVAVLLGLTACSESSTPTSQTESLEQSAAHRSGEDRDRAIVYVGHGINGTDLGLADSLPVDISVNGDCVLEGLKFRAFAGPLELPAGDYAIAVSLANRTTPCGNAPVIGPATVTVNDGDNATILAHLTDGGKPTASVFANEFASRWRSQIAARHAANFGPVDVVIDEGRRKEIRVPGLTNGHQVSTAIRAGRHTVAIEPAGTGTAVYEVTLWLRPRFAYYAYAVGTPSKGTFEVLLQKLKKDRWSRHDRYDDRDEHNAGDRDDH